MSQSSQAPLPAEHGSFLQPDSVGGHAVDFVQTSDTSAGRLTLQATGDGSLRDYGYFDVNLYLTYNGFVYDWDSTLAWNYMEFYIDGASSSLLVSTDQYRYGSTAISTRGKQAINIFESKTFAIPTGKSHHVFYFCQNLDSSSHTIDGLSVWKYIIMGTTFALPS
jgi:hypothetical protein